MASSKLEMETKGEERDSSKRGVIVLCNNVCVITNISFPLVYSTGWKQVPSPTHTQGRSLHRDMKIRRWGRGVWKPCKHLYTSSTWYNHVHKERMKGISLMPGTQRTYSNLLTVVSISIWFEDNVTDHFCGVGNENLLNVPDWSVLLAKY